MSNFESILAPIAARCPRLLPEARGGYCEFHLNIGLFFDGTDNNKGYYPEKDTNTNIARLWDVYRDEPKQGYFRHYVSGVGTPFIELKRKYIESGGSPFGAGGASRIHYGLLQVANSIHRFLKQNTELYVVEEMDALCSSIRDTPDRESGDSYVSPAKKVLRKAGLSVGLDSAFEPEKRDFFTRIDEQITELVKSHKIQIVGIYLDVFGFSRGAAQARVFATWLHEYWLKDGRLFGVPSYVRILGLFDTVASVGPTDWAAMATTAGPRRNICKFSCRARTVQSILTPIAATGPRALPEARGGYCEVL